MSKTAIIGFYSHAYSKEKMKAKIEEAVKVLEETSVTCDFFGLCK
ncbi:MAG: hypothetical protein ACQEP5_10200 [Actinomycetota bacterium]